MSGSPAITHVGVVIPVHNEQDLLEACLHRLCIAMERAAAAGPLSVELVIVLDQCTDHSADIVTDYAARDRGRVRIVTTAARSVGAARAAGMNAHLDRLGPDGLWLATTDADSQVPPDWLLHQLAHHKAGADAVLGTVEVKDWSEHPKAVPGRYARLYQARHGHRHVHGANLALTAHAYLSVGGFAAVAAHEDVLLVRALLQGGWRLAWAHDLPVTTSARRVGRTPTGFAQHLRDLALEAPQLPRRDTHPADVIVG